MTSSDELLRLLRELNDIQGRNRSQKTPSIRSWEDVEARFESMERSMEDMVVSLCMFLMLSMAVMVLFLRSQRQPMALMDNCGVYGFNLSQGKTFCS
jgi:hypothetical protein